MRERIIIDKDIYIPFLLASKLSSALLQNLARLKTEKKKISLCAQI